MSLKTFSEQLKLTCEHLIVYLQDCQNSLLGLLASTKSIVLRLPGGYLILEQVQLTKILESVVSSSSFLSFS